MFRPRRGAEPTPSELLPRLALLLAGVLWSLGGAFIKAFSGGVPGVLTVSAGEIVFYRSLAAGLLLAPFLFRRGLAGPDLPRISLRDRVLAIVLLAILLGLYVAATQGTTAANAIFLQYTAPVYVIALSPLLLRERWRRADVATLAMAGAGIGVLAGGELRGLGSVPVLLGGGSGLCFGLFLIWMRRLRAADPLAITGWNNLGVALVFLLGLAALDPAPLELPSLAFGGQSAAAATLGLLALMGLVQIAAPYVLFSTALRRVGSVEASLLTLVEPVLNPIWVVLLIGERPSAATLAGGSLIVLALALRYTLFHPLKTCLGDQEGQSGKEA